LNILWTVSTYKEPTELVDRRTMSNCRRWWSAHYVGQLKDGVRWATCTRQTRCSAV